MDKIYVGGGEGEKETLSGSLEPHILALHLLLVACNVGLAQLAVVHGNLKRDKWGVCWADFPSVQIVIVWKFG